VPDKLLAHGHEDIAAHTRFLQIPSVRNVLLQENLRLPWGKEVSLSEQDHARRSLRHATTSGVEGQSEISTQGFHDQVCSNISTALHPLSSFHIHIFDTLDGAPDVKTPPQTPERPEKRPRPGSYAGMMVRSSSRAKKGSSRQRRRSRQSSQEVDSLKLSDDLNQNATASQGLSSPEGVPSTPESNIHEEHSPQLNDNMAIVDSDLLARSSVRTKEENPQHASPAPETSPTHERACPTVSANELATPSEAVTGPSSSFIVGSSPEADTQREGFDQACLPAACTNPVSTADSTDTMFSLKASGYTHESQQNSLDILDQLALATSAHYHSSHDSTIKLPSITSSQTKYTTVSKQVKELYLEGDAIPSMSGILQACVKYHEKTADFQDGDCLVTKVLKGMGAIMKPPTT
jgi:hypothetical protein